MRRTPTAVHGPILLLCALALGACGGDVFAGLGDDTTGAGPETSASCECGPCEATVARVVDGDTIELDSGERVRYIGVDTPETYGETECFGPEAKAFNETRALGERVRLEYDEVCTDHYGRLLAYVRVGSDEDTINEEILQEGYGRVLIIPPADRHEALLRAAEERAREAGRGLWGACE